MLARWKLRPPRLRIIPQPKGLAGYDSFFVSPHAIDVGMIGDHVFACACMLGTPGRIARHREEARKQGGGLAWLRMLRGTWRSLHRARPPLLHITAGGARWSGRTGSLTITVNPLDDGCGRAFGRSALDGGVLCAYVVQPRGVLGHPLLPPEQNPEGRVVGGAQRALDAFSEHKVGLVLAGHLHQRYARVAHAGGAGPLVLQGGSATSTPAARGAERL